jgi:UDPglucose--hexose-1-phosphate uridylyltransferase
MTGRSSALSEMRQDPVTGVWTVLEPARAGRPKDFSRSPDEVSDSESCPFCAGREEMTPPTRYEAALAGSDTWTVRVVENAFPALTAAEEADGSDEIDAPGPYRGQVGFGVHEVIVETPLHGVGLADLSDEHATLLIDAYVARLRHWRADGRFAAAVLFRNWGRAAGASLSHAHTQFAAFPRVPEALVREIGNFAQAASASKACPLCEATATDDADGRTVWDDGVTALSSPWAAPIPYFMRIAPHRCTCTLADTTAAERASFGAALRAAARAVRGAFGDVAFNVVVHDGPYSAQRAIGLPYHWHAEVVLRTSDQAGFEWGSGTYINVIDPDEAAATLRDGLANEERTSADG